MERSPSPEIADLSEREHATAEALRQLLTDAYESGNATRIQAAEAKVDAFAETVRARRGRGAAETPPRNGPPRESEAAAGGGAAPDDHGGQQEEAGPKENEKAGSGRGGPSSNGDDASGSRANGAREAGAATPAGKAVLVNLADVTPTKVRWVDKGRIPLGALTVLDGDPKLGKSTLTLDYAARVSTGREMPDGGRGDLDGPAGVVILSAEDSPEHTIRPKLDAMAADCSRIRLLKGVCDAQGERMPDLADLGPIEEAIGVVNAKLVIVDPLMAYVPDTGNPNSDHKVRRLLAPLAAVAQRRDVAVLVVRHLNKRTGEAADVTALYRGGGSIGIAGAARSVLLVAPDKGEPKTRRVLASVGGNLSKPPAALAFHLDGPEDGVATIVWDGEVEQDADDLVRPARAPTEDEEPSRVEEACDFLRELLTEPVDSGTVKARAAASGISERTLWRAKKLLNVRSGGKLGMRGHVFWFPPGVEPPKGAKEGAA